MLAHLTLLITPTSLWKDGLNKMKHRNIQRSSDLCGRSSWRAVGEQSKSSRRALGTEQIYPQRLTESYTFWGITSTVSTDHHFLWRKNIHLLFSFPPEFVAIVLHSFSSSHHRWEALFQSFSSQLMCMTLSLPPENCRDSAASTCPISVRHISSQFSAIPSSIYRTICSVGCV